MAKKKKKKIAKKRTAKRGRPKKQKPPDPFQLVLENRKKIEKIKKDLIAESPIASDSAKDGIAGTLAGLLIYHDFLLERATVGGLPAEVQRTIPSVSSNIKRLYDALDLTKPADDGPENPFADL